MFPIPWEDSRYQGGGDEDGKSDVDGVTHPPMNPLSSSTIERQNAITDTNVKTPVKEGVCYVALIVSRFTYILKGVGGHQNQVTIYLQSRFRGPIKEIRQTRQIDSELSVVDTGESCCIIETCGMIHIAEVPFPSRPTTGVSDV